MISNLESWRHRVAKAATQASCDALDKSIDRLWEAGCITRAEFLAMDDAVLVRRTTLNAASLDELGEPFPDVAACIADGQSPRMLEESTRRALADASMTTDEDESLMQRKGFRPVMI